MREKLLTEIQGILEEKGEDTNVQLADGDALLGGSLGFDSLDLAVLVTRMQEETGADPFKDGFVMFNTFGELVNLFEKAETSQ